MTIAVPEIAATAAPPRPLRVLQLGLAWFGEQPGGLERYYAGLVAHGAEAGMICRGLVTGSVAVAGQSGGRVTAFAAATDPLPRRWLAARRAVAAATAAERFDLWASHFALYAFPVVRQLGRLPHVVHFHGPWAAEAAREGSAGTRLKRALERRVYRSADRLIVLSDAFRSVLCDTYRIDPDRVRVVPGGIDVDHFDVAPSRAQAREQLGWPTDRPILLCVRRLVRRMGLPMLLGAVDRLRGQHPDLLCMIGGKGPLTDELRAQIQGRGLQDHVRLLGFVADDQLPLAYRAADLSVVPSEAWEGFGLVAAESLAAGTPVVVTPVGGLPEVVRGLSADLVTSTATVDALADRLADCLSGRVPVPTALGCQAYARARFAWPEVARQVAHVYREAL